LLVAAGILDSYAPRIPSRGAARAPTVTTCLDEVVWCHERKVGRRPAHGKSLSNTAEIDRVLAEQHLARRATKSGPPLTELYAP